MKKQIIVCICAFLLYGCVSGISDSVTISAPTLEPVTATPSATAHLFVAPFTPVPSKTPTPEPTKPISVVVPTYQPDVNVQVKCVDVNQPAPQSDWGIGQVVLENRKILEGGRYEGGLFILNMHINYFENIMGQPRPFGRASVSPDQSRFSAVEVQLDENDRIKQKVVIIISNNGDVLQQITPSISWQMWASNPIWLDNDQIIMDIALDPDENAQRKLSTSIVLNPFTGEEKILKPDYPDAYVYDAGIALRHFKWLSGTAYNAALTRVVYLGEKGLSYVLWDLQKNKPLMSLTNSSLMAQPRWSPDGTRFAMLGFLGDISGLDPSQEHPYALYMIDQDGKAAKLIDDSSLNIDDYFWSPSGRYLALFLNTPPNYTQKRIAILDTQTLEVVDTCLQIPKNLDRTAPVWSPDETQILLDDAYEENHRRVILVDMKKNIAFPIAEDMIAVGWMNLP